MRHPKAVISAVCGIGLALATAFGAAPATAAGAGGAAPTSAAGSSYAAFDGSKAQAAGNKAFFEAVLKSVAEKRATASGAAAVTVTYSTAAAPTFRSQIASSAQIWNSSVANVRLQAVSSGADFTYREGNDSRGSYASTNGHGRGYIFLDYAQNRQYNPLRVVAHETGHVLGLPDHYTGPCSEVMSGHGPGPSCQNAQPNAAERARVNTLWANGLAAALARVS